MVGLGEHGVIEEDRVAGGEGTGGRVYLDLQFVAWDFRSAPFSSREGALF